MNLIQGWAVSIDNVGRTLLLHGSKLLLLIPFGFLSFSMKMNKLITYFIIPFFLFVLEFMQIVFNIGISDIDSVIFMVIGYFIGILIGNGVQRKICAEGNL